MYSEKEFSKCLFPPTVVDMFVAYPQLEAIRQLSDQIDNKLMKYIVCVYDYRSPIVVNNRDLRIRKQLAAEFAHITEDQEALFAGAYDYLMDAIDLFLRKFIHNRIWALICCNENLFYEYSKRVLQPISNVEGGKQMSDKDIIAAMASKTTLSENMASISDRLDVDYKKLYGDEVIKFANRATSPEQMAIDRSK